MEAAETVNEGTEIEIISEEEEIAIAAARAEVEAEVEVTTKKENIVSAVHQDLAIADLSPNKET